MKDIKRDIKDRVEWIKKILREANASGIIYGNSGGKDCTLVSILCKMATDNVLGVIMPCESKRNYTLDTEDAMTVANQYNIQTITVDITPIKKTFVNQIQQHMSGKIDMAYHNINPRLRMATLYSLAQDKNYLVAGTGNKSEITMGYYTKWGDGASDFNPIADLTVTEVFEYLRVLDAPSCIIDKKPSAALYEGQTDEDDMGISYNEIDEYIKTGECKNKEIVQKAYKRNEHKRIMPKTYKP